VAAAAAARLDQGGAQAFVPGGLGHRFQLELAVHRQFPHPVGHQAADARAQRARRDGRAEHGGAVDGHPVRCGVDHRGGQVGLVGEVGVHRTPGELGGGGDVLDARGRDALLGEDRGRRLDHPVPDLGACAAWHGRDRTGCGAAARPGC